MKYTRYTSASALCLVALSLFGAARANGDIPTLPPVTATGVSSDGIFVMCVSYECANAIDIASFPGPEEWNDSIDQDGFEYREFCSILRANAPVGCSVDSPPSTPGLDSNWAPNGCGVGGYVTQSISYIAGFAFADYTGNIDSPYPGVSFLSACNEHDRCWGAGGNRESCDGSFHANMRDSCAAGASGAALNSCNGIAAGYFSLVSSTNFSNNHYQQSVRNRTCARWAKDMEANNCEE